MTEYLTVDNFVLAVMLVVTLASAVAKGIDLFTDVHPDDDLDETASTIRKYVAKVRQILGKLGLNSDQSRQ